jgi:hypothetical protein
MVESQGRKVNEWQDRPNHPDNHGFDCLVGCCVGASMLGAVLDSLKPAPRKGQTGPRVKVNLAGHDGRSFFVTNR